MDDVLNEIAGRGGDTELLKEKIDKFELVKTSGNSYLLREKCQCAYCRDGGMSKTAEECVDRMNEATRALKKTLKEVNVRRKNEKGNSVIGRVVLRTSQGRDKGSGGVGKGNLPA